MYLKKRTFCARISLESMLFSHIFVNTAHSAKMADFEGYLEAGEKISEFYKVNPKLLGVGGGGGGTGPQRMFAGAVSSQLYNYWLSNSMRWCSLVYGGETAVEG